MQIKTSDTLVTEPKESRNGDKCVLILGLGNSLLRDEGVGVHVAEELQKHNLPGNIEVIDGGTACLDVFLSAMNVDKLVVVDALKAGEKPGTIYKLKLKAEKKDKLKQIFSQDKKSKISLHQVGLLDALGIAEKVGCEPEETVIIGVEPGEVNCGLELTEKVKHQVPEVVRQVLEEIKDDIHSK